jgi:6-phosphogluconolactonase
MEIFNTADEAAAAAADTIGDAVRQAVQARAFASLAGSGGATPGPAYDRLAASDLPWAQVRVTLTDERWVPPAHPDSNEGLLRRRLLVGPAAAATLAPLWSPANEPAAATHAAETELAPLLPLDVVLLGMGADGHIASLFPGSTALDARGAVAWAPAAEPAPSSPRLTLTFDTLAEARLIVLLIGGAAKRQVLEQGRGLPIHTLLARRTRPTRILWAAA